MAVRSIGAEEEREREIARKRAIFRSGRKFITLRLIDQSKNRIQGAMVLEAIPYNDGITNQTMYHFQECGRRIEFVEDTEKGEKYCSMLDCEHNRRFLASMLSEKFWEIEEPEVLAAVKIIAKEMAAKAEKAKENIVKDLDAPGRETLLSDEELESEEARIVQEKAKRKLAIADLKGHKVTVTGKRPETELSEAPPTTEPEAPETTKEPDKSPAKKAGRKKSELVTTE